jgi:hypothetical protein
MTALTLIAGELIEYEKEYLENVETVPYLQIHIPAWI